MRAMLLVLFPIAVALVVPWCMGWRNRADAAQRQRQCEERLALVHGTALDRVGFRYGLPRMHGEEDAPYRRRLATARARSFAI